MAVPIVLDDGTQQYFTLALPEFVVRATPPPQARLQSDGAEAPFELFEDVNSIAVRDLQDRGALILARATARAIAKFQAARAVQRKAREAGGGAEILAVLGTNLFNLFSEEADIRSWRTLPGRIWVARLDLPAGTHDLTISVDQGGVSRIMDLGSLDLAPGAKKILVRTLF
jgi:hypothetical protein